MFQDIVTGRLLLRRLRLDDSEEMFAYRSDPRVFLFQSWEPKSKHEVSSFIDKMRSPELSTGGWHQLGIALKSDDRLIGDCGIHIIESDPRIAEIAVTVTPAEQRQGYASEALKALLQLLFVEFGKHRIFASVDPRNQASMALMHRSGLRKEGHFIQSLWFKESWVDDVVFAMLAGEWQPSKNGE